MTKIKRLYCAPEIYPKNNDQPSIFLAGSIDMGAAIDWQHMLAERLSDLNLMILNPRRLSWDNTWRQSIDHPLFREQVEWELDALDYATHIVMFFSGTSKAPITLLELGLHAKGGRLLIACEPEFWRRGNVEIIAHRYQIPLFESLQELEGELRERLKKD